MSRWWADAAESRSMLSLVDDSDVEQGVGTAVLAYHGLAMGVLEPLTRRTLMDVSAVRHALAGVDLEPVAKAMAAATTPIMGDAAPQYGELMARDLHQRATDATERLLLHLTTSGMAWPTAIERVATVHGVPLDRLGKAASQLSHPALPPMVRADIGDRALMDYAMHVGLRENTLEDVSKANQDQFDPNDHPRGARGRFVDAPDRLKPQSEFEARQARRQRRLGRIKRQNAKAENARRKLAGQVQEQAPAESASLMSMLRNVFEEKELAPIAAVAAAESKRAKGKEARANARRRLKSVDTPAADPDTSAADAAATLGEHLLEPVSRKSSEYNIEGERVALVSRAIADQLVKGKGAFVGRMEQADHAILWMTPEDMAREVDKWEARPDIAFDYVIVHVDGRLPTASGARRDFDVQLAPSAKLELVDQDADAMDAYDVVNDYQVKIPGSPHHPNPARKKEWIHRIPVLQVTVANADDYGQPIAEDGPPLPYDRASKAFNENEVRRDGRGRFADEPNRMEPDMAFQARQARRQRRLGRAKRANARREKAAPAQRSVLEMTPEAAVMLRQMIEADELVQGMDSVVDLQSRRQSRGRLTGKEGRKAQRMKMRGAVGKPDSSARSDGALDMASAQVIPLSDNQILAMDRIGEQDIHPVVRMAAVLANVTRNDTKSVTAMHEMALKARREVDTAREKAHMEASFEGGVSLEDPADAYAAAQDFVKTLLGASGGGERGVTYKTDDGVMHVVPASAILTLIPYTQKTADGFKPMAVSKLGGVGVQTMFAGTPEDMAKLKSDVLPDEFIEGETTFYAAAKAAGMNPEEMYRTPDFPINTIRPVFGQNSDE